MADIDHILKARLVEIEKVISDLQAERAEIHTALDVVSRYADGTTSISFNIIANDAAEKEDVAGDGSQRPDGIPTIWDMAEEYLKIQSPATAADIIHYIRDKYWPGVAHAQIGPSLYRFVNDSRLIKVGRGAFALPTKENDDAAASSEAKAGGASDTSSFLNLQPSPERQ